MRVVVPFAVSTPKTRLGDVLTAEERRAFARAMLRDVLDAVEGAGHDPEVLATGAVDVAVPVRVDDRPLTEAVNARLSSSVGPTNEAVAVVMADLPLVTPAALADLFGADGDVVLAPGRGGGTNALVSRHPEFRVDYHGLSFRDHRQAAARVDASVTKIDSNRVATDVDEPADLLEVLLHGEGSHARQWLVAAGFEPSVTDGRGTVTRIED